MQTFNFKTCARNRELQGRNKVLWWYKLPLNLPFQYAWFPSGYFRFNLKSGSGNTRKRKFYTPCFTPMRLPYLHQLNKSIILLEFLTKTTPAALSVHCLWCWLLPNMRLSWSSHLSWIHSPAHPSAAWLRWLAFVDPHHSEHLLSISGKSEILIQNLPFVSLCRTLT